MTTPNKPPYAIDPAKASQQRYQAALEHLRNAFPWADIRTSFTGLVATLRPAPIFQADYPEIMAQRLKAWSDSEPGFPEMKPDHLHALVVMINPLLDSHLLPAGTHIRLHQFLILVEREITERGLRPITEPEEQSEESESATP